MFNINLEEKSYKINFKALPIKIQRSKNRQGGGHNVPLPPPPPLPPLPRFPSSGADRVKYNHFKVMLHMFEV